VRAAPTTAGPARQGARRVRTRFMSDELDCVWPPPRSAWASTRRTSAGSSTAAPADSVDSFYQELGRAGATASPPESSCSTARRTSGLRRFFAGSGQVREDDPRQGRLPRRARRRARRADRAAGGVRPLASKLTTAVSRLEDAGALEVLPTWRDRRGAPTPPSATSPSPRRSRSRSSAGRSTARAST
jgi:ATP-dependent DNA helicase RecQ